MKAVLTRLALASPAVFTIATLAIGIATPGYSHMSMTVSRLSLGSYGWIQSINLIFFACALFAASELLIKNITDTHTRTTLHRTFLATAGMITLVAIFPTDPIDTFPKQIFSLSGNAVVHFGLICGYILLTPVGIRAISKTFRRNEDFKDLVPYTLIAGFSAFVMSIVWFVFFYFGILDQYRGIFQKIIILEVLIWLTVVMVRAHSIQRHKTRAL